MLPFNIASYGLLLSIVAQITGYIPRHLIGSLGDTHIYNNHIGQVSLMTSREPLPLSKISLPDFSLEFYSMKTEDQLKEIISAGVKSYKLVDYVSHPPIKGKMAI